MPRDSAIWLRKRPLVSIERHSFPCFDHERAKEWAHTHASSLLLSTKNLPHWRNNDWRNHSRTNQRILTHTNEWQTNESEHSWMLEADFLHMKWSRNRKLAAACKYACLPNRTSSKQSFFPFFSFYSFLASQTKLLLRAELGTFTPHKCIHHSKDHCFHPIQSPEAHCLALRRISQKMQKLNTLLYKREASQCQWVAS